LKKVKLLEKDYTPQLGKYLNGNTRIDLCVQCPLPTICATINLGEKLPLDQAYINDYDQSGAMIEALLKAGIILKILGYKKALNGKVPLCQLNFGTREEPN